MYSIIKINFLNSSVLIWTNYNLNWKHTVVVMGECAGSNKTTDRRDRVKRLILKAVVGAEGREELGLAEGQVVNCYRVAGAINRGGNKISNGHGKYRGTDCNKEVNSQSRWR